MDNLYSLVEETGTFLRGIRESLKNKKINISDTAGLQDIKQAITDIQIPKLFTPIISVDNSSSYLTINDDSNGDFSRTYDIFINEEKVHSTNSRNIKLTDIIAYPGESTVGVQARSPYFLSSDISTTIWHAELKYTLLDTDAYECSGMGNQSIENLVISSTYNNKSVVGISEAAFDGKTSIKTVYIPDSILYIEKRAFYYCTNLKELNISNSVEFIGTLAFAASGIESVIVPDSVTSMDISVFAGCSDLEEAVWGNNLNMIPERTFINCQNLKSVTIGKNVTSIGAYAFYNCANLTDVYYTGTEDEWNAIDILAFNNILNDAKIHYNIPGTEGLEYTLLQPEKKYECTGIGTAEQTDIIIAQTYNETRVLGIGEKAFFEQGITSVYIPYTVKYIAKSAFESCSNLKNVIIEEGISRIESYAFSESGIEELVLPKSINSLYGYAFAGCQNLKKVIIKASENTIYRYTFYYCRNLTSVTIPKNITRILQYAFKLCNSLTDVYYTGTEEEWNAVEIEANNEALTNATIHYNSTI